MMVATAECGAHAALQELLARSRSSTDESRRQLKEHLVSIRHTLASETPAAAADSVAARDASAVVQLAADDAVATGSFSRLVAELTGLRRQLVEAEALASAAAAGAGDSRERETLVAEIQILRGREQAAASASSSTESTIEQLKAREKKLRTLLAKQRAILKEREKELVEERKQGAAARSQLLARERSAASAAHAEELSAEVKIRGEALRVATDDLEVLKAKWRADAAALKDARDDADALRTSLQRARLSSAAATDRAAIVERDAADTRAEFDSYKRRVATILANQTNIGQSSGLGGQQPQPQPGDDADGDGGAGEAASGGEVAAYKERTAKMLREANVMTARYKAAAQRNAETDAKTAAEMEALRAVAAAAAVERDESRLAREQAEEDAAAVRREGAGIREALSRMSADLEAAVARASAAEQAARSLRRDNEELQAAATAARDAANAAIKAGEFGVCREDDEAGAATAESLLSGTGSGSNSSRSKSSSSSGRGSSGGDGSGHDHDSNGHDTREGEKRVAEECRSSKSAMPQKQAAADGGDSLSPPSAPSSSPSSSAAAVIATSDGNGTDSTTLSASASSSSPDGASKPEKGGSPEASKSGTTPSGGSVSHGAAADMKAIAALQIELAEMTLQAGDAREALRAKREQIEQLSRDLERERNLETGVKALRNTEYLKHVLLRWMRTTDRQQQQQLLPVIAEMLQFSSKEVESVRDALGRGFLRRVWGGGGGGGGGGGD